MANHPAQRAVRSASARSPVLRVPRCRVAAGQEVVTVARRYRHWASASARCSPARRASANPCQQASGHAVARTVRPGRVYYDPRAVVESEYRDKPPELIAFAEQVRRWLRRWCKKREDLLLAPSLAARFDRGEIVRKGIRDELELVN